MMNKIESEIENTFKLLMLQFNLSDIKRISDSERMKTEIKKLEKYAEKGRKFYGKKYLNVEKVAFLKIESTYDQASREDIKRSYREIAFHIARTELGIDKEADQKLFYKRFLKYKKKKNLSLLRIRDILVPPHM
jgi:competence CoiA-like predicted nuclease